MAWWDEGFTAEAEGIEISTGLSLGTEMLGRVIDSGLLEGLGVAGLVIRSREDAADCTSMNAKQKTEIIIKGGITKSLGEYTSSLELFILL